MTDISRYTTIDLPTLRSYAKDAINNLLPTGGYSSTNVPNSQMAFMLTTRESLLGDIYSVIDETNIQTPTITENGMITVIPVFNLVKKVFVELGRCRKIYYYAAPAGSTATPQSLADSTGASSSNTGTFAYFKKSFAFTGNYASPAAQANSNTNVEGYKTLPEQNVNNWQNNTTRSIGTARISTMSINNIIQALEGVEQQLSNFVNDWSTRNASTGWWSGIYTDETVASNRVFFVRYWCHSNCHSNCRHSERSRR